MAERKCSLEGCGQKVLAKGYCQRHYHRVRQTGSVGPVESTRFKRGGICIIEGCGESVYCKRRCGKHYYEWLLQMHGECSVTGCSNPAAAKGLCAKHYAKVRKYGDPNKKYQRISGAGVVCKIKGCGKHVVAGGLCASHYIRKKNYGSPSGMSQRIAAAIKSREGGTLDDSGYRLVYCPGHSEANRRGGRWAAEHRKVMADYLGRPLRENENIHHVNGRKTDNRIQNLELWVSSQPSGQRVQDLVEWARHIESTYGDEYDKHPKLSNGKEKT